MTTLISFDLLTPEFFGVCWVRDVSSDDFDGPFMTPEAGPMESIGSQESSDDWKRNSYLDVFFKWVFQKYGHLGFYTYISYIPGDSSHDLLIP